MQKKQLFSTRPLTEVGRKRPLRRAIARVKNRPRKPGFSDEAWRAATAFFIHKLRHPAPVPYEKLTPLQKRMQSGLA